MKKLLALPLLLLFLSGSAQIKNLYYKNDWSKLENLKDSVLQFAPGYKVYKATGNRSEYKELIFDMRDSVTNDDMTKIEIRAAQLPDGTIGQVYIRGNYDVTFKFFKRYIKASAIRGEKEYYKVEYKDHPNMKVSIPVTFVEFFNDDYIIESRVYYLDKLVKN